VFVIVEALVAAGRATFTDPLAIIGTLSVPLLGGIFPMLLLAASRHRGDRDPDSWVRVLRGPVSMTCVALVFFVGLLVQGFVIWQEPLHRIAAALVALLIALLTMRAIRRGSFRPRAVIEVRRDPSGRGGFSVHVDGRPETAEVRVVENGTERSTSGAEGEIEFVRLRRLVFGLPSSAARELRVWVHGVTAEGDSQAIPSTVEVVSGDVERRIEAPQGKVITPVDGGPFELRIVLDGR
jgi:hypothetical protein